jgi:PAS domain S-box-containing protein
MHLSGLFDADFLELHVWSFEFQARRNARASKRSGRHARLVDTWRIEPIKKPETSSLMTATLALIGGVLQLTVPSYALRLVRRYGAERVGWFVVIAFSSLALLQLIGPMKPVGAGPAWQVMPHIIYAVGSVLLLIGMGHIETLVSERERAQGHEQKLQHRLASKAKHDVSQLAKTNEELLAEIARRDQLDKPLRESEAQYRLVFTENPQPMWIFDVCSSRFLAVNNAALRQYGFTPEEFSALTVRDLLPGTAVGKFLQFVAESCSGSGTRGRWQHYRKDGTPLDVEISATDITYDGAPARLVLAEDVGERTRNELASRQADRMELLGRVAGGVADHFNNMLTIIQGHTSVLLKKTNEPETIEQLNQISSAATRATSLTRRLLLAAGRHPVQPEPLDLNGLIRGYGPMLRRLVGERIVIENTCGSFLAPALVDRYLMEYILINLMLNARDAMPNGGTIAIGTATLRLEETQAQGNREARAGEFVRLSVSDTGCGMTPEVQAHLFEPFGNCKDLTKGTGLGLAGVYSAVKQMSGWIECTSDTGIGTEFRIFLPPAPAAEVLAQIQAKAATPVVRGTILLVEPEDKLRSMARCVLNWNEYKVVEADNADTALLLWNNQASKIDLLLTDMNLPGNMSGRDLAHHLQKAKPGLKVMYTSALSLGQGEQPPMPADAKWVSKPYSPHKLIQTVQICLGGE